MDNRERDIRAFLTDAGWADANVTPVPGDASARRYHRLNRGRKKAVLMDVPMDMLGPICPVDASLTERRALGYNAVARLAGINPEAFVCVTQALNERGFSAPRILASDLPKGLVLLEDLGDDLYARVIDQDPEQEKNLYAAAVDCLAAIYRSSFSADVTHGKNIWHIRGYDEAAFLAETDLMLDWYARDLGHTVDGQARQACHALWSQAFTAFDAHAPGLCLRDFHAENLFWLPSRQAIARVGLIDYQDALFTHPAYDLVSLLEDARRDVSPEIIDGLKQRFCEKAGLEHDETFASAYAVMGAQRNAKILGIFIRLSERDGKPQYRDLMPRVSAHFKRNLDHPVLADLKAWFADNIPEVLQ